ncbi:hypothetical protein Bbelb_014600 [Branchiostoma belcheri]|nr:hypothetical protein Bbelb_014600 [Branchiostoma belcheri]
MTGPLTFSLLVALSCSVLVGSEKLPAYDPADYRPGEAEDWKQTWRELLHSILPDRTRAPFALPGKRAPFGLPGKRAPFSLPGKRGEETQDDLVPEEWAFPVQPVLSMPSRRAPSLALPGKR